MYLYLSLPQALSNLTTDPITVGGRSRLDLSQTHIESLLEDHGVEAYIKGTFSHFNCFPTSLHSTILVLKVCSFYHFYHFTPFAGVAGLG